MKFRSLLALLLVLALSLALVACAHVDAAIEVIPSATCSREGHLALASLVFGDGCYHQSGSEEVLVTYIVSFALRCKVHDERAHDGVVVMPSHPCQGVYVGHEVVAQAQIISDAFIGGMPFGSDVPWLTVGILSVRTI